MRAKRAITRRGKRALATVLLALTWSFGVGLAGCKGTTSPTERPPKAAVEEMEGGRSASPNRRASDERPKPFAEEKGPLDSDRMGIEAYRVRKLEAESKGAQRQAGPPPDAGLSSEPATP